MKQWLVIFNADGTLDTLSEGPLPEDKKVAVQVFASSASKAIKFAEALYTTRRNS